MFKHKTHTIIVAFVFVHIFLLMTAALVLQDVNGSNSCHFPVALRSVAVIVNPCNCEEILIFHCDQSDNILIYNRNKNKIKAVRPKDNKENTDNNDNDSSFTTKRCSSVHVFAGNTNNTVIVLWTARLKSGLYYAEFNCDTMQFDVDSEIQMDDKMKVKTVHKINNLLFVIGNTTKFTVLVYDTFNINTNEKKPKRTKIYQIANGYHENISYSYSTYKSIMYVDKDNINIYNIILFGNIGKQFSKSFHHVIVDSIKDDISINLLSEWNIPDKIADTNGLGKICVGFSYHWYQSRYLIIIGASHMDTHGIMHRTDQIMCFDCVRKHWHISEPGYSYKIPNLIAGHASLLLHEKNELYMYIFGKDCQGLDVLLPINTQKLICWKLSFLKKLDWKIERLIWIGYYKNNCNSQNINVTACKLPMLGKDVVLHILSFIKRQFLFE